MPWFAETRHNKSSPLVPTRITPLNDIILPFFRVGLRARPLTQKERLSNCTECVSYIPNEPQILIGTDKSFTYDYVFDSNTDQASVYSTAAHPLVQKFMEG